jgi:UDP-3-O-[3-hydroxymyristoyl] glucosamine N-acyltransferase
MVKEYTVEKLAHELGGRYHGKADTTLSSIATLTTANESDVAYIDNPYYRKELLTTKAGAVITTTEFITDCKNSVIIVANPLLAINECISLFNDISCRQFDIHPSAIVNGLLGAACDIAAHCVVANNVRLGDRVTLGANVVLDEGVIIGDDTVIDANVTIAKNCTIGERVIIGSGTVIGSQPFNPVKSKGCWHDGPNLGAVTIGDDVSIAANCSIDSGSIENTHISKGVKIDNLVQIAHDVSIGEHTIIAGCAAIGAHTTIGEHCVIGGGSCIAGFLSIEKDVVITGMSTVTKPLRKEGIYTSGTTVSEHQKWRKNAARFKQLDSYIKRLKQIEKNILE